MRYQPITADPARPSGGTIDRIAMALSGLCVVHCVASAIAVGVLASVGGALADPRIHEFGLAFAILLGAAGLGRGVLIHGARRPLAIGGAGLALMAIGLFVPHGYREMILTISGVSLLALGHQLNRRAHRC